MAGAGDGEQSGTSRDERERGGEFVDGGEAVAHAGDEERRSAQRGEMRGAQLGRALRRVQRIAEQQERVRQAGFGGAKHGRLPASVGMAAEEDAAWGLRAHGFDGQAESGLIARGAARRRRAMRPDLAEGEIVAEDGGACIAEGVGERDEES